MERDNEQKPTKRVFTEAQIERFANFGDILQQIHYRLVAEGYFLDPEKRIWDIFKIGDIVCTFELED